MPCPLCRVEHEQLVLESTSSFGPPDLDTRPASLARDAFVYDAARCPQCGFVFLPRPHFATDFIEETPAIRELLDSRCISTAGLPHPAEGFRRAAMIAEQHHQHADAGWALLRAAWLCDDASTDDAAMTLRLAAVERFRAGRERGQKIVDPAGLTGLLLCDLLRRAGHFSEALDECLGAVEHLERDGLGHLIAQERELIAAGDSTAQRTRSIRA